MFYSHILLTKKGPLAKVWLAAHWDKRITKAQVFETDLCQSVDAIKTPQVKLSLRTSGHLLLGVVKLHNRKARYLLSDCNTTLVGIKMAYRPMADVPIETGTCLSSAVTLREIDLEKAALMMDGDFFVDLEFENMYQARLEDITMREEAMGHVASMIEDNMMNFGNEVMREADAVYPDLMSIGNDANQDEMGLDLFPGLESLMETSMRNEPRVEDMSVDQNSLKRSARKLQFTDDGKTDARATSFEFAGGDLDITAATNEPDDATLNLFSNTMTPGPPVVEDVEMADIIELNKPDEVDQSVVGKAGEALVLQPIDTTQIGTTRKARRKRRLVVDTVKSLTSETIRKFIGDTSDTLKEMELAPPTKRLMFWRGFTCEKMMEMPTRYMPSNKILDIFKSSMSSTVTDRNEMAVADVLNEPLVIETDESAVSSILRVPDEVNASVTTEVARNSLNTQASMSANISNDLMDEMLPIEQSIVSENYPGLQDNQPNMSLPFEERLTRSMTKENRNRRPSLLGIDSFATPNKRDALRSSLAGNITLELPSGGSNALKTPSRIRRVEESLSKRLFTQGLSTPKNKTPLGDSSLLPLEHGSPRPFETPKRIDGSSTFTPHSTHGGSNQESPAVHKEDQRNELLEVIRLLPGIITFKKALTELESKSGKALTRRRVASTFHALLELTKRAQVQLSQSVPYGEIQVFPVF